MGSSRKNRECYRWKKPILIGARRVLDKIICDLKFTKKKKIVQYSLSGFNPFTDKCSFNSHSRRMKDIFLHEITN